MDNSAYILTENEACLNVSILAENEARLKQFYLSAEPETTLNYKFIFAMGPITVKYSGESGRGMFLTAPAAAGQLLLVDNAVASCACVSYIDSRKADSTPGRPRISSEVHKHLVGILAIACRGDEGLSNMIFQLDSVLPDTSDVDSGSMKEVKNVTDFEQQLWNIVANNAFCHKVRSLDPNSNEPNRVEMRELWGLWVMPSFMNHSCSPNCHRMRVGDAVFIRAARDIAAGEEVTVPYFDIFQPLFIRQINCDAFGFWCDCCRCTFERSIGKPYDDIQKRIILLSSFLHRMLISDATDRGQIHRLLQLLEDMIDPTNELIEKLKTDRKNKAALSPQRFATCGPIKTGEAMFVDSQSTGSQEIFDSEEISPHEYWVVASFIEPYIAKYSQCTTGSLRPGHYLLECIQYLPQDTEQTKIMVQVGLVVSEIVEIIREVHPGDMLGQEFVSIELKARRQVVEYDIKENRADHYENLLDLERDGMEFFSSYYGFRGDEVLKVLLATGS